MKINAKRNLRVNRKQTQSTFEISNRELQQNLHRKNSENNIVGNSIENMTFRNFWVV